MPAAATSIFDGQMVHETVVITIDVIASAAVRRSALKKHRMERIKPTIAPYSSCRPKQSVRAAIWRPACDPVRVERIKVM